MVNKFSLIGLGGRLTLYLLRDLALGLVQLCLWFVKKVVNGFGNGRSLATGAFAYAKEILNALFESGLTVLAGLLCQIYPELEKQCRTILGQEMGVH